MILNKKIGIIGGGNLGNKTWDLFATNNEVIVYDIIPEKCSPVGTLFNDIINCWVVIICISLPNNNGIIDTDIIIDLVGRLNNNNTENIIIRTKVPPGTCDSLNSYYLPDIDDGYKKDNLILGVSKDKDDIEFKKWMIESLNKNIQILTSIEVEVITLSIKSYSSVKIAFFKELQNYCNSIGIKYDKIKKNISDNQNITTLSKKIIESNLDDLFSLEYQIRRSNISTSVLSATIRRLSELE
jgi:hypothetical protein